MQPVQLSLIPDPVPTPITGAALTVGFTPMVEQLPTEAVATAIALLASVIAKAAAAMGGGVVGAQSLTARVGPAEPTHRSGEECGVQPRRESPRQRQRRLHSATTPTQASSTRLV